MREGSLSVSSVVKLFFENVVRFFGILGEVVLDGEPSFTASF